MNNLRRWFVLTYSDDIIAEPSGLTLTELKQQQDEPIKMEIMR